MKLCLLVCVVIFQQSSGRQLFEKPVFEISAVGLEDQPVLYNGTVTQLQIAQLQGTLYSNSFTKLVNITELRIIRNQIDDIQAGALCSAPLVKILEVDLSGNTNPPVLRKEHFDNCQNLEELFLKFDYILRSQIDDAALEDLPNLTTLALDCRKVGHLKKSFLKLNAGKIKKLVLSDWRLTKIDRGVFDDFPSLEELQIVYNPNLLKLPEDLFQKPSTLKVFMLKDNQLSGLTWDEFKNLHTLEELNLFDNQIDSLDVVKFHRNMPQLKNLDCGLNSVSLKQTEEFEAEMKTKFNHTVKII